MKKEELFILVLMIFSITIASAVPSLNFQQENHQPGETLLAEITLDENEEFSKQISPEDIQFFKERKQVFFEYDLTFYGDRYYFYSYLTQQGNFTIKINNILYKDTQTEELKSTTIEEDLEINENQIIFQDEKINETTNETYYENKTTTKILSIKPGFVFSNSQPKLIITNKGESDLNISYNKTIHQLLIGESKQISIITEQRFSYFNVTAYETFSIPLIKINFDSVPSTSQLKLRSNPSNLQIKINQNEKKVFTVQLLNFAETNLTNITISTNLSILELNEIDEISAKSIEQLNLTLNSEKTGVFQGSVIVDSEENSLTIPIEVYVFPENTDLDNIEIKTSETCGEIGGTICSFGEDCDGEVKYTGEFCCLGTCKKVEPEKGSNSWLIGVGIFILLAIIGFFVYRKFKKTKQKLPEQKLKDSSEIYEKRIRGNLSRT